jgi:hypothetical protein
MNYISRKELYMLATKVDEQKRTETRRWKQKSRAHETCDCRTRPARSTSGTERERDVRRNTMKRRIKKRAAWIDIPHDTH